MLKYIGGNSIHSVLRSSRKILHHYGKTPIINFAMEETNNKNMIFDEHMKLLDSINQNYKIAIKLSSFEFDKNMISNLIDYSITKNIQIIIDAEKNVDNQIYQHISNDLMLEFNKTSPNVIKTYQMYRKDSYSVLEDDLYFFRKHNVFLGTKLVRGAYWNSEYKQGHLYKNKIDTDFNYNKAILFLYNHYDKQYNILATHNKQSIYLANTLNQYHHKHFFSFAHLSGLGAIHFVNNSNRNRKTMKLTSYRNDLFSPITYEFINKNNRDDEIKRILLVIEQTLNELYQ